MSKRPASTRPESSEMSLDEAVKVPPKDLMTPKKQRIQNYEFYEEMNRADSPPYSAARSVVMPTTAEARKMAEDATKSEEKRATGRGRRKTRRRLTKRRATRRRHGKKRN